MKIKLGYIALLFLLLVGCKKVAWEEFTSVDGKFAVFLPGTPTETTDVLDTPVGKVDHHKLALNLEEALYEVSYSNYPDTLFEIQSANDILNGIMYTYTAGDVSHP